MRKADNNKVSRDAALAALFAVAALLLPEVALADDDGTAAALADSSDDRIPAITAFPKYPSLAYRDRIEGEATVCFAIDKRGRVIRPSVRSSTHRIFDKAAMRAIRDSSFEPLGAGEKPAVEKTCRTYRFRLDPVSAQTGEDDSPPLDDVGGVAMPAAEDRKPANLNGMDADPVE